MKYSYLKIKETPSTTSTFKSNLLTMFSLKTNSEYSLYSNQSQSCLFVYHYLFFSKPSYWLKILENSGKKSLKDVMNSTGYKLMPQVFN